MPTTTPPPQQAQPTQQQAADAALAAAVGAALLSATSAAAAMPMLLGYMAAGNVANNALNAVLEMVLSFPPGQTGAWGAATLTTERLNLQRRALFVVAAAKRVTADLQSARSRGLSISGQLQASVQRERRYYAQHLIATWQRSQAGAKTDSAALTYGNLVGWHTVRDAKTSPDCLAANGLNFYADHMPLIGYPGAVHPHCRCEPGSPFPGARLLPSYGLVPARVYRRAA